MKNDFKLVQTTRGGQLTDRLSDDKLKQSIADNMGNMIDLAKDIVDIKKMQVQSDACLAKMEADRKMLLAEAEAYAIKKNSDIKDTVNKMIFVQNLLKDFYKYNQNGEHTLTGEEFTTLITNILNTMER